MSPIIAPIVCKVKVVDSKKSVTGAGLGAEPGLILCHIPCSHSLCRYIDTDIYIDIDILGTYCVVFRVHTLHI